MTQNKKCSRCHITKDAPAFNKQSGGKYGLSSWCKECKNLHSKTYYSANKELHRQTVQRYRKTPEGKAAIRRGHEKEICFNKTPEGRRKKKAMWLQHQYGLSLTRHKQMWIAQKGKCDLCGKPLEYEKVHTDHNHINNALRGLTCVQCNNLLGLAYVDECGVEILEKAIDYVKRHEQGMITNN